VSAGTLTGAEEGVVQLHSVQRLALLHLSWSSLELGDYIPALSWASQLLALEACPPALKAYAHLYAADALTNLSRTADAAQHLAQALELGEPLAPVVSPTGVEPSAADGEGMLCVRNPYSPVQAPAGAGGAAGGAAGAGGTARAVLYTNLAVVHVLQRDTRQARAYVTKALEASADCQRALLCLVYLELEEGRTESAVELLKKQRLPK